MNTKKNQNKQSPDFSLEEILDNGDKEEIRALFSFDSSSTDDEVYILFNIWGRYLYPGFYKVDDAPFHEDIDRSLIRLYRGTFTLDDYFLFRNLEGPLKYLIDIAFRGAAKTTRTKLFVAFAIANDTQHTRKYYKVLASDGDNSQQIVTDIYNMLIIPRVQYFYSELFRKTNLKRQETMSTWTTATGVKVDAGTVGTEQRGDLQGEESSDRPDFIWFDDFETRTTIRSAVKTHAIWDNMEEAREGLSADGVALYNCNYLSERGNVHRLVTTKSTDRLVLINPIIKDGQSTWPAAFSLKAIETKKKNASDWAGEYLCEPSVGADVYFERATLDKQEKKVPIDTIAGFKIFHKYDPSHRYGSGHDVAKGVKLDSSTSVFIDFTTLPFKVVGTFASNELEPRVFAEELVSEAKRFGKPIVAIENNKYEDCIGKARDIYDNLYFEPEEETKVGIAPRARYYGWNTNGSTKSIMLGDLKKAVHDGHLELSDPDLIAELRSYTRDDLMDRDDDVRLTTRHFDLLIACAIAFQMKNLAVTAPPESVTNYQQEDYESPLMGY
jgi:hypothetical protein